MRVVPMRTYQHLYEKQHIYTMCPVWNMHLSIMHTLHHAIQLILLAMTHSIPHLDQCATTYPSVVIRFTTPPQYARTLPTVPEIQHQNPLMMRNHQMRMRISRQYLWTMNIGQQRWFQKEHSAYMRMGCPIMCAHNHALMDIMAPPHI